MSAPTQLELLHRNEQTARLLGLLADGDWHLGAELADAVGWRFGQAVERIRKGMDGRPAWFVLRERLSEDGQVHRYRFAGVNPNPPKPGGSLKGQLLAARRRIAELEAEVVRLRGGQ
jgi:hypothetical protein